MKIWNQLAKVFLLAAMPGCFHVAAAQVVLIVNPNIKVDRISKDDIRDIFTGTASNFRNGPHVRPVMLNKGVTHDEFMSTYIGLKDPQFHSIWSSLLFAGQTAMPPSFDSESDVVTYVAQHIYTVGYIRKGTPHEGVKVLEVK